MKKISLFMICALLSPLHILSEAQEATKATGHKTTKTKKAGSKKQTKKSDTARPKTKRTKTTTAGKSTAATTKSNRHAVKATTKKPRTKTTTAGTKTIGTKSTRAAKPKNAAPARAAKSSYKNKPATQKSTVAKKGTNKPKATRAYHKGGVKYRQFNHLNEMHAENFGVISKPTSKRVALNKPGRGYVNANLINLTTADGKQGKLLFDTHNRTAAQAQKKGIGNVATKTVEVYAGTDANDLALIGEYPLAKDNDNIQVDVDPSGQVMLADNGTPFTKFSIHQHQK